MGSNDKAAAMTRMSHEAAGNWMRWATYASVFVAAVLLVIKGAAWLATGSVAMLGSLVDSGLDAVASLVTLFAVRHAVTPPDYEHRFGHGKAEAIAGLGQAVLIAGSALFLLAESVSRFARPEPVVQGMLGIVVIVISIGLTLALVAFQRVVIAKTRSLAISADSLHYKGDLLMNMAVIAALALSSGLGFTFVDPLFGMGIAGFIGWSAWQIVRGAFDELMDRELPEEDRERIKSIVLDHRSVRDMHDLRTRNSGTRSFIQLHIELDPRLSLVAAHHISDEVEEALLKAFPNAEVIIHQDPEGHEDLTRLEAS